MRNHPILRILYHIGLFRKKYRFVKIYEFLDYMNEDLYSKNRIIFENFGSGIIDFDVLRSDVQNYKRTCRYLRKIISSYYDCKKITEEGYEKIQDLYDVLRRNLNIFNRHVVEQRSVLPMVTLKIKGV